MLYLNRLVSNSKVRTSGVTEFVHSNANGVIRLVSTVSSTPHCHQTIGTFPCNLGLNLVQTLQFSRQLQKTFQNCQHDAKHLPQISGLRVYEEDRCTFPGKSRVLDDFVGKVRPIIKAHSISLNDLWGGRSFWKSPMNHPEISRILDSMHQNKLWGSHLKFFHIIRRRPWTIFWAPRLERQTKTSSPSIFPGFFRKNQRCVHPSKNCCVHCPLREERSL